MTKLKKQDIEFLTKIIKQWNSDRLDLFEISVPNEVGEFFGVMRFYFQEEGEKVATKCIRVTSTATATQVINTLIEKFRPDMKLLSRSHYSLYEVHINGDERKIEEDEKPLLVQLNWNKDDREGRFLLKREDEKSKTGSDFFYRDTKEKAKVATASSNPANTFKRRLSGKRDTGSGGSNGRKDNSSKKKGQSKADKGGSINRLKPTCNDQNGDCDKVGDKLYAAVPETCFTRSISNPEAVMRRRRQQKLEKKLRAIQNGGATILNSSMIANGSLTTNNGLPCPDKGGTLKIYGETLNPEVPYKTLLLSINDTAAYAVKETLSKYGMPDQDPSNYCLYQIYYSGNRDPSDPNNRNYASKEYILGDRESPIAKLLNATDRDKIIFRIGRKPSKDTIPSSPSTIHDVSGSINSSPAKSFTSSSHNKISISGDRYSPPPPSTPSLAQQGPFQRLNQSLDPQSATFVNKGSSNGSFGGQVITNSKNLDESTVIYETDSFFDQTLTSGGSMYRSMTLQQQTNAKIMNGPQAVKEDSYPYLVELRNDGSDITERNPMVHHLASNVIEIGSECPNDSGSLYLQLKGSDIFPKHCILTRTTNNVCVTPCRPDAGIWIDGKAVRESTVLRHGAIVRFGTVHALKFYDPSTFNETDPSKERKSSLTSVKSEPRRLMLNQVEETHLDNDNYGKNYVPDRVFNNKSENQDFLEFVRKVETLPAFLDIYLKKGDEDLLLSAILPTDHTKQQMHSSIPFKLAPAYMLYLCGRYCVNKDTYHDSSQEYQHTATQIRVRTSMHRDTGLSLGFIMDKITGYVRSVIESYRNNPVALTFWMANVTETLYALRRDDEISRRQQSVGLVGLRDCARIAFTYLNHRLRSDLATVLPNIFQPPTLPSLGGMDSRSGQTTPTYEDVVVRACAPLLKTLTSLMNMLKQHRLNASLTIQLFSQLFRFINAWTFNAIFNGGGGSVLESGPVLRPLNDEDGITDTYTSSDLRPPYSRDWGTLLKARFGELERWSERNGLELAAECHFGKVLQLLRLLVMPKACLQDIPYITSTCNKLNSLQFYTILTNYRHAPGEPIIPNELIERVVSIAHNTTDVLYKTESDTHDNGMGVKLEETLELGAPFVIPEDGYSYDGIKNVTSSLLESIKMTLTDKGLANLIVLPSHHGGAWNVHFKSPSPTYQSHSQPMVKEELRHPGNFVSQISSSPDQSVQFDGKVTDRNESISQTSHIPKSITITKTDRGLGLSIVAAVATPSANHSAATANILGIYVKAVVKGGAAEVAGAPRPGDHLLSVNGHSLVGLNEESAARLMGQAGPLVCLTYFPEEEYGGVRSSDTDSLGDNYQTGPGGDSRLNDGAMAMGNAPQAHAAYTEDRNPNFGSFNYTGVPSMNTSYTDMKPPTSPYQHTNDASQTLRSQMSSKSTLNDYKLNLSSAPISQRLPSSNAYPNPPPPHQFDQQQQQFYPKNITSPSPSSQIMSRSYAGAVFVDRDKSFNRMATGQGSSTDIYKDSRHQHQNYADGKDHNSVGLDHHHPIVDDSYKNDQNRLSTTLNTLGGLQYAEHKFGSHQNIHSTAQMKLQQFAPLSKMEGLTDLQYGKKVQQTYNDKSIAPPSPILDMGSNSGGDYSPLVFNNIEGWDRTRVAQSSDYHPNNIKQTTEADLYTGGHLNRDNLYASVNKKQYGVNGNGLDVDPFPRPEKNIIEHMEIGPKEKIALCQEMIVELETKSYKTQEENDKLKALIMENEFQKRVLEDEELNQRDLSDDEDQSQLSPNKQQRLIVQTTKFDNTQFSLPLSQTRDGLTLHQSHTNIPPCNQQEIYDYARGNVSNLTQNHIPTQTFVTNNGNGSQSMQLNQQHQRNHSNTDTIPGHQILPTGALETKPRPPDRSSASFEATNNSRLLQNWIPDTHTDPKISPTPPHQHQNYVGGRGVKNEGPDPYTNAAYQTNSSYNNDSSSNLDFDNFMAPSLRPYEKSYEEFIALENGTHRNDYEDTLINNYDFGGRERNFIARDHNFSTRTSPPPARAPSSQNGSSVAANCTMVNTSVTPGVIGAQEIYLDPRVKLQMLKKQQQQLRSDFNSLSNQYPIQSILKKPKEGKGSQYYDMHHAELYSNSNGMLKGDHDDNGSNNEIIKLSQGMTGRGEEDIEAGEKQGSPERMSFREKMKKFAQVSGSQYNTAGSIETGMDKLRISKTQKKIEDSLHDEYCK